MLNSYFAEIRSNLLYEACSFGPFWSITKGRVEGGGRGGKATNGVRERELNSKTLILKDSSIRSIWTYLTASLCYTTMAGGGGGGQRGR